MVRFDTHGMRWVHRSDRRQVGKGGACSDHGPALLQRRRPSPRSNTDAARSKSSFFHL